MIRAADAIRIARALIGTPYAVLDCINLIKKVIRDAPGGKRDYTTAGTNTLWRSYDAAAKYRDLTWRQDGIAGAMAGMIAFKADGEDYHHAGIVTDSGTVIHSSSTQGGRGVVETPLSSREGWTHLAVHRYIEAADKAAESAENTMESYKALVKLNDPDSALNVRNEPSTKGVVIGRLFDGQGVIVQAQPTQDWLYVTYGDSGVGYVHGAYIAPDNTPEVDPEPIATTTLINIETGDSMVLMGAWRVAED